MSSVQSQLPSEFSVVPCWFIANEASFLVSSMARIFAIYIYIGIFQAVRHDVNVLNVSTYI